MTALIVMVLINWIKGGIMAWVLCFAWAIIMGMIATHGDLNLIREWNEELDKRENAPAYVVFLRVFIWPYGVISCGWRFYKECECLDEKRRNRYLKNGSD